LMSGVVHFLDPYRYRSTFHKNNPSISESEFTRDYLNHLEEIITYEGAETIAAIIIETVTGTNGIIVPPEGYLQGLREICDKNNILLICDEVMSGFGRTGEWFAVDNWNVIPDIMTMAKGLTSAYAPLGAVAMRDEIAEFFDDKVFYGGLTYNSHPISLAAAIANINIMKEDRILENVKKMGAVLRQHLNDLGEKHASVGEVRSIGLFSAIEVVRNRETREPMAPYNGTSPEMDQVKQFLLDNGVFTFIHWNVIMVNPPLIINEDQLLEGIRIIDQALTITDAAVKE
jgi:taurine--2-oxoglutarate transaminase